MSLPTSYLTTARNLQRFLDAIRAAQAPKTFAQSFLESLGFTSSSDRLFVGVLKALGFLDTSGAPTNRYFEFLDQTQSARVLAEAMREAYSDLFQINKNAQDLTPSELRNKLRTLSQGKLSDDVLQKMVSTFKALAQHADFTASTTTTTPPPTSPSDGAARTDDVKLRKEPINLGGLVYNIQIVLPESRDQSVYDALFKSLRTHLL